VSAAGRSPLSFDSRRLWSLWDMMRVHALEFFGLGASAAKIAETIFYVSPMTGKGMVSSLHDFQKEAVRENIAALTDLCKRIGLPVAMALLDARKNNIPQTRGEWDMLVDAVRAELKTNLFLFVPMHRAKYYEMALQDTLTTAFPDASKELVLRIPTMPSGHTELKASTYSDLMPSTFLR
jgi:hypothetical protein